MNMMRPQLARFIEGRNRRTRRTPLKTFTSKNLRQSSSGISWNGLGSKIPRLLTRIATSGWRAASSSAAAAVLRSPANPCTSAPVADVSCAATPATDDCDRPLTITRAPSRANAVEMARPMPAVLPLTKASLPFRFRSMAWSLGSGFAGYLRGGLGASLRPAAICEVDRRVENHLVARLDAVAHFHGRSQIARDGHLMHADRAVLDHGDVQPVVVENDGVGGHDQRRRFARNVQLDRAIDPRRQRAVGIAHVDLGEQRARAGLQRVGDPRHRA